MIWLGYPSVHSHLSIGVARGEQNTILKGDRLYAVDRVTDCLPTISQGFHVANWIDLALERVNMPAWVNCFGRSCRKRYKKDNEKRQMTVLCGYPDAVGSTARAKFKMLSSTFLFGRPRHYQTTCSS